MINIKLTNNMCELIGAIIGDGNIYDNKGKFWVEMSGHPLESDYFSEKLIPIIVNELKYTPRLFLHSGAIRFRICNKKFVLWLKELGIPTGRDKGKNVRRCIP